MKFVLEKDKLKIEGSLPRINSGSVQYYLIDIEHDETWNGLTIEAKLVSRKKETRLRAVINNQVYIDTALDGSYTIGFVGYRLENQQKTYQISTNFINIPYNTGAGDESLEIINGEEIPETSEWERYLEQVDEFITDGNAILEDAEDKIEDMTQALENVNTAITATNNLNLDVNKVNKIATVTLTKKDASVKTVQINDGLSLQFMWQGTSLGIKTEDQEEYTFVDLQGIQGVPGPQGEPFTIKKTYATVELMVADYDNMEINDYVMISGNIEQQENATLWVKTEQQAPTYKWQYLADFSGATGIQGPTGVTPNIQIGNVTSGDTPSVTRTGTNENPVFNFVLKPGPQGPIGLTGNGISSILKTATSGLVDTYTITYTNGNIETFDVTNGNGIVSITKTATVGSVDTYTITFDNGNTTTFDVTNGEVTQAQLDEVIAENESLKAQLPTGTGTGEYITLTDSAGDIEWKSIKPNGKTEQETTLGTNFFDISKIITNWKSTDNTGIRNNGDNTLTIHTPTTSSGVQALSPATLKTYCPTLKVGDIVYLKATSTGTSKWIYLTTSQSTWYFGNQRTITQNDLDSNVIWYASGNDTEATISDILVCLNSSDTWEKFTYGASPNPQYPQEIKNVEGSIEFKIENNFNPINWNSFYNSNKLLNDATNNARSVYFQCKPNISYVITKNPGKTFRIATTNTLPINNVNVLDTVANHTASSISITTGENANYLWINYFNANNGDTGSYEDMLNSIKINDIKLNTNEPHAEQTCLFTFEEGQYLAEDGYLADDGIHNVMGKVLLNETRSWTKYSDNVFSTAKITSIRNCLSDYYIFSTVDRASLLNNGEFCIATEKNGYRLLFKNTDISTLEEWLTWVTSHNILVEYEQENPQPIPYTETQQAQWNAIKKMKTYKNVSHISTEGGTLDPSLDVVYYKDLETLFNNLYNS